jgi:hypothetical protein
MQDQQIQRDDEEMEMRPWAKPVAGALEVAMKVAYYAIIVSIVAKTLMTPGLFFALFSVPSGESPYDRFVLVASSLETTYNEALWMIYLAARSWNWGIDQLASVIAFSPGVSILGIFVVAPAALEFAVYEHPRRGFREVLVKNAMVSALLFATGILTTALFYAVMAVMIAHSH